MTVTSAVKAPVTPGLRPCYDLPPTEKWVNRRKNVRLVAEVVRLVAEVMGDRRGQISCSKVVVMFKSQSHRAYDQVTTFLRSKNVVIVGKSKKERTTGRRGRGDRKGQISRNKVDGHVHHDWSYDRSLGATIDRTIDRLWLPLVVRFPTIWWILSSIFSNRCWLRDHAYDQSYDDLPPAKKTDRSMRPLLEIVANIADRSHVRQITTNHTIKQSYDPVWLWL